MLGGRSKVFYRKLYQKTLLKKDFYVGCMPGLRLIIVIMLGDVMHPMAAALVGLFFLLTLIVGLVSGRNITGLHDYAVAGAKSPVPVLLFTMLLASHIGGGVVIGVTGEIYMQGIGALLVLVGIGAGMVAVSKLVAPNFDDRFKGMISQGDMIEAFYGKKAEGVVVLVCTFTNTLLVSSQFIALGYVLESLLGIDYITAIAGAALVVGLYATFGGVRAVIATDVMQLIAIIVVMVLIAIVACIRVGDFGLVKGEIWNYNVAGLKDNSISAMYCALPFFFLYPTPVQRFLMAKSPEQIAQTLSRTAFFFVVFGVVLMFIGLSARHLIPDVTEANAVLPTLITYLFKDNQLMLSLGSMALIAAILSTADSILNSVSVMIAGKLEKINNDSNALLHAKIATIAMTLFAALFALTKVPVFSIMIGLMSVDCILGVVTFCGIMRLNVSQVEFWYTAATTTVVGITCIPFFNTGELPLICSLTALGTFLTTHFVRNKYKFVWIDKNGKEVTSLDKLGNLGDNTFVLKLISKQVSRFCFNCLDFIIRIPKHFLNWFLLFPRREKKISSGKR